MLKSFCLVATVLLVVAAVAPRLARASTVETDQSNATSASAFLGNISNSDLINTGSADLSGVTYTGLDSGANTSFPGLNDGGSNISAVDSSNVYLGSTNQGAGLRTATYNLDTVANPRGFDITQINTFDGFGGSPPTAEYADQRYTVYVSFVGSPAMFHLLDDVTYYPFFPFATMPGQSAAPSSSEVSLTDSTGMLASGVAAIEFVFPYTYDSSDPKGIGHTLDQPDVGFVDGQLVQEVDVFGSPTPEPASLALLGVGSLLVLRRRK